MRFSLKWALAAMAYVALAAAAIGANSTLLADLLCAIPFLAFCYATVVALMGQGGRQAVALGLLIACGVWQAC